MCLFRDALLTVRLADPSSGTERWYLPGGTLEEYETPIAAAIRETKEETSFDVVVEDRSERVLRYDFPWNGKVVPCETYFYRAQLVAFHDVPAHWQDAPYHRGIAWLPLNLWWDEFSYHPKIRDEIAALLK